MAIACVVLDLDGTITDLAREAAPFSRAYRRLLGDLVGRDLGPAFAEEEDRVRDLSPELAWVVGGHGVAPAAADPYVLATCTAARLCDRLGVLADPALRVEVLSAVLRCAYQPTPAAFRPEARAVIEGMLARGLAVHVLTNAATDATRRKLAALAPAGADRIGVQGDARKFLVGAPSSPDDRFDRVPAERRVPGLLRPVLPRRGRYFDALSAIWAETGASPGTTLVCGDIFELDLALPAELGAHVHLVSRPETCPYEMDAVRALGRRGGVSEGLAALLERLP